MTGDRLERLAIRCVAPVDRRDDAVTLERRLRRIAQHDLPGALAQLLPRFEATVGSVSTRLPESIAEHDDATIALLWASEIARSVRTEASAMLPTTSTSIADADPPNRSTDSPSPADAQGREPTTSFDRHLAAVASATTAAVAWWEGLEGAAGRAAGLQALATLIDRLGLTASSEPSGISDRRSLMRWLETALRAAPVATAELMATWFTAPRNDLDQHQALVDFQIREEQSGHPTSPAIERRGANSATEDPGRVSDEASLVSQVGGITLLYPWLVRLLTLATDVFGESAESRMSAIWTLLDTPVRHDPLLAIVAGAEPGQPLDWNLIERSTHPLVDDEADRVWDGFADLLPGFWHKQTLVSDLIVRSAPLHRDGDGWVVSQTSRPLDVLVASLPYPITYFQFGWTRPISVRWPDG